ncbi:hypothetical protein KQX54_009059 [Cotesia glomerata]|uniref:Uncharacterized protein n=1 Tax=Cotesia glomerata TaxID=32391 RepID=A0AAV7IVT4_COTGL|nr:hypothetical protein KQX54_009059 [Cotesia glomerata]
MAVGVWAWKEKETFSNLSRLTNVALDPAFILILVGKYLYTLKLYVYIDLPNPPLADHEGLNGKTEFPGTRLSFNTYSHQLPSRNKLPFSSFPLATTNAQTVCVPQIDKDPMYN